MPRAFLRLSPTAFARARAMPPSAVAELGVVRRHSTRPVKLTLISLLAFAAAQVCAREEAIPECTSPDKRYHLAAEEVGGHIYYRIKQASTGKNLIAFRSDYQPDPGSAADDWAFRQTLSADIHWRSDSRCVAIEESNHRRIGTVIIARRTSEGFRRVPLSCDSLMRRTKAPWERGRLFFDDWSANNRVSVVLVGLVWADPESTPPEKRHRKEFGCGFTIALDTGKIVSMDPQDDTTK